MLTEKEKSVRSEAYQIGLNGDLAVKQKVPFSSLLVLRHLHSRVREINQLLLIDTNSERFKRELPKLVKEIKEIEFEMQKLWNFDQNEIFHTHTFNVPNCTCKAKMVNGFRIPERFGEFLDFSKECMVHKHLF